MNPKNTHVTIGQRGEQLFDKNNVMSMVAEDINEGHQMQRQTNRRITPDFQAATETIDAMASHLEEAQSRMLKSMDALAKGATDASRKARSSASDMAAMLDKINRGANYERLERNVALLERTAVAMQALSDLEKTGQLSRVIKALQP